MSTPRRQRKRLGSRGEDIACAYLAQRGYIVADRNWRYGHLELDVVAHRGGAAHVVEVKTRYASQSLDLSSLVSARQELRLLEAADAYAQGHDWVVSMQIDVLVIVLARGGGYVVEFIENAIAPAF